MDTPRLGEEDTMPRRRMRERGSQPGEDALGDGTLKAAAIAADRAGIQSYLTHHQSELRSISDCRLQALKKRRLPPGRRGNYPT